MLLEAAPNPDCVPEAISSKEAKAPRSKSPVQKAKPAVKSEPQHEIAEDEYYLQLQKIAEKIHPSWIWRNFQSSEALSSLLRKLT